jgi:hypothetical protein
VNSFRAHSSPRALPSMPASSAPPSIRRDSPNRKPLKCIEPEICPALQKAPILLDLWNAGRGLQSSFISFAEASGRWRLMETRGPAFVPVLIARLRAGDAFMRG